MPSINLNHEYPEINQADANALAIGALNGVLKSDGANGFSVVPVDAAPTASSTNLVESGGVKAAIDAAVQTAVPKRTASNDPSSSSFSVLCDTAIAGEAKPKLYGKSAVINQLANHGNFDDISGLSNYGVSISASNNVLTMTALSAIGLASGIAFPATVQSGRKYYIAVTANFSKASSYAFLLGAWSGNTGISTGSTRIEYIGAAGADGTAVRFGINRGGALSEGDTVTAQNFNIIDLTAIFTAAELTAIGTSVANLKAAWLKKFGYPLPQYIDYDAGSIVSNNATYQMHGRNLWDEEWELGRYDTSTGAPVTATDRIRCKNPIAVAPNTRYCFTGAQFVVYWYDASGAFISYTTPVPSDRERVSPDNAAIMKFNCTSAYGTTYKSDICVNISDASFNGTYEPYYNGGSVTADDLNGFDGTSVQDTQDADGQEVRKVGTVDLSTITWNGSSGNYYVGGSALWGNTNTNLLHPVYYVGGSGENSMNVANGNLIIRSTATPTGILYYAKATPTTESTTAASLTTQAGYNCLDPVSGDVQSADASVEYPVDVIAYIDKKLAEL